MKKASLFFGFMLLALLIAGCASSIAPPVKDTNNGNNQQNSNIDFGNFKPGVEIVDGKQIARLSWGKLNYEPSTLRLKAGIPTKLIIDPERLQGCFRSIAIPDLGIQKSFTEADASVEFTPEKKGTYSFGCTMGMGGGTLVVE